MPQHRQPRFRAWRTRPRPSACTSLALTVAGLLLAGMIADAVPPVRRPGIPDLPGIIVERRDTAPATVEIRAVHPPMTQVGLVQLQQSRDLFQWLDVATHLGPPDLARFDQPVDPTTPGFFRLEFHAVEPAEPMVWLPPGEFVMGSPPDEVGRFLDKEEPQTRVRLTRGFWMGAHEVTQAWFREISGFNPSLFADEPSNPVENVRWTDAVDFCARLTARERRAGRLPEAVAYRLPTEAEWEYATRAGTTTRFSYGDDPGYPRLHDYAWYGGNSGLRPHPVGQKLPNPWGLHDVHGNVFEWCSDWFDALPGGVVVNPVGPPHGLDRIIRGGYWDSTPAFCRSAARVHFPPSTRIAYLGFRVVLALRATP